MDLSEKLKELREQNNFTQEEIANLLNISRQSISKWERGITSPDIRSLYKLSKLYNISMESLIDSDEILEFDINNPHNSNNKSYLNMEKDETNYNDNINNDKSTSTYSTYIKNYFIERHRRHIEYHKNPKVNIILSIIWAVIFIVIIICSTISAK